MFSSFVYCPVINVWKAPRNHPTCIAGVLGITGVGYDSRG